jgi:hypothetical protein
MSAFDPKSYEDTVVKPLRRWSGRLPDDLVSRYAIELTMSDAELKARLGEVRAQWHKGAQSTGRAASVRSLYKAFLREDDELKRANGDRLDRISWWREHERVRAAARQGQVKELATTLRESFGELRLISPSQLEATMRAAFTALAPDEVDQALADAGVTRTTPLELPTSAGLPDVTFRALRQHLVDAQAATVPELLFGPLKTFQVLHRFACDPPQLGGLSPAAVQAAVDRENKRAVTVSQAPRAALGVLSTAVRDGVDIRQLTLFHLLVDVRQHHAQGAPPGALVRQLVAVGLAEDEARMAVFSVRNESAPAPSAGGLDAVRDLLADGQLVAAKQALATVTSAADAAVARELVDRQIAEVHRLRTAALVALRAGDEATAATQLRQAVALATDDEDIAAELRAIPPPQVLQPLVRPDGVGVRVSWRPAPGHDEATRYRVVRRTDRLPVDPDDGQPVYESGSTAFVDASVPAGRLVGYAVFAAAEQGPWSRPAGVTIEVFPPVQDIRLVEDRGVVEATWRLHPDAASVEVRRGDHTGQVVRLSGRTSFRDRSPATGFQYTFVARYRKPDGSEGESPWVSARAASKDHVLPVTALQLTPVAGDGSGLRIAVRWRQPTGATVVVRRAEQPCTWEFGAIVPMREIERYGEEVRGTLDADGEWHTLTSTAPTGLFHYVPFTLDSKHAVRGADNALGIALPVTGLEYRRFGPELALSWIWPEKVGTAEVRWAAGTQTGRVVLTRQRYQTEGGCRIPCGTGEIHVRVRSVVAAIGGACYSADAEVVVPERPPSLRYTVALTRRPLRGAIARVRLVADEAVPQCMVLVVAAHGVVMPRRATDGQVVLRSSQELRAGDTVDLTAELPRLARPYWVRCFVGDEPADGPAAVRLVDPPTSQLKVT